MKHKFLALVPLFVVVLLLMVSPAAAEINAVTPSTNDINRTNGWAFFDVLSTDVGSATVQFTSTRGFYSCFEIRTDGDTGQIISEDGGVNPNLFITDGLYPYFCINNTSSPQTHTIAATAFLEIRMVFGAETDERFDWTRVNVDPGCHVQAPASVNEGADFTASVVCTGVDGAYGFQFGTSLAGEATTKAGTFDPGDFVDAVPPEQIYAVGDSFSAYSASRLAPAAAATGTFSLASGGFTANTNLLENKTATLTLNPLLLGDISGANMNAAFASTTTITILDLLTLNLTVKSDGGGIEQVRDVTASVDSVTKGPASGPGNSLTLVFDDEISRPTSMLTADMKSHLECTSDPFALTASVTDKTITLKAGDVTTAAGEGSARINVSDSFIIGLAFGSAGAGQEDVNADGTVNVLDLIHVGRNYGAVTGACS